ncbi:hypothetical protein [Crocinitomix algicola]|uniref:hypothetical protein n=1 Tax=Crocinitomix algicola TaxID=1740263 RepID=UPI000A7CA04D|nr:hypothetical protein [Crocinitomix algicola]
MKNSRNRLSIGKQIATIMVVISVFGGISQENSTQNTPPTHQKYSVSMPLIILPQLATKSWNDRTHTQHFEFHIKRNLDQKNIVGLKFATWRLFQPMGITWWDGLLDKIETKSEFYPGHLREIGLGISYQRMIYKGLFATVEVLPQFKTYLDENKIKVGNGFKLYNSFHIGYHFDFGKKKQFFLQPQVHSQFWVFDTNTPAAFNQLDQKWRNYFLLEPNLYFGIKF